MQPLYDPHSEPPTQWDRFTRRLPLWLKLTLAGAMLGLLYWGLSAVGERARTAPAAAGQQVSQHQQAEAPG